VRALAPAVQHKLEELAQTVQARRDGGETFVEKPLLVGEHA
jgi:CHASE3 domain sensor protein